MWARLERRTLLSLILRFLFLKPVATGTCPGDGQELLQQLQNQADLMQHTRMLLDPYVKIQGLTESVLKHHCQEHPVVFPREHALQALSKRDFLRTLNTVLDHVLHRLTTFKADLPKGQDFGMEKMFIRGIKNNIYCMAQLLRGSSETAHPTQAGPGTSPPSTTSSHAFQRKLEGCRFLGGFHSFMHSVGQVLRKWRETPSQRSRRHSPLPGLQKAAHRMQPSTWAKRLMPRGQLPR